jgi:hypothetical protein
MVFGHTIPGSAQSDRLDLLRFWLVVVWLVGYGTPGISKQVPALPVSTTTIADQPVWVPPQHIPFGCILFFFISSGDCPYLHFR